MASLIVLESGARNFERTAVEARGFQLLALAFSTLGIIYSDIGTSPLYVLNGIWPASGSVPSQEDVIGGVSAIIWSLTLIPLLKYVFVSLYFGTREGEGGTFALYQGIYPPDEKDFDNDRTLTGDSVNVPSSRMSSFKRLFRWPLLIWCLCGTALTMADGVFTPAVSVTSAVGGIAVAKPSVAKDVTGIAIAFLVPVFFVQRFGTTKISALFSPIALIWFLLLAGTGIYNITRFPGIFRAFDPSRAVMLFVRTGHYDYLSGILLAFTGAEAIFANLGQFNRTSIRLSFCFVVYPALVLAYLGQGASLIVDGENVLANIFYQTIPGARNGPLFWIVFVFAILATLIASQAMITATFSLFQQVINFKSFPPLRLKYTSDTIQGQVYVPAVNWALFIAVLAVVGGFSDLSALTNAYGFAVSTVSLSTSLLLGVHMCVVKRWPVVVGVGFILIFGFFDGLFWGAAVKKVPHGAWVPLMLGGILAAIMVHWTWAKGLEDIFDGKNRVNLRHFILQGDLPDDPTFLAGDKDGEGGSAVEEPMDDPTPAPLYYLSGNMSSMEQNDEAQDEKVPQRRDLTRIPTCAVFHKFTAGRGVPHTFVGFIRQYPALPRVVVFLSVCVLPTARITPEARYIVQKTRSLEGFYSATYHLGFREKFDVKVSDIIDRICDLEASMAPSPQAARTIEEIRRVAKTSTHITPHYHVLSKRIDNGRLSSVVNWVRSMMIEEIYNRMATMFPETTAWMTPADEIIHVGVNAVI
ncbi:potassium transporter [Schizophyllum amplum]|uniref:Potassium transporter n=1 Tax=Schizophyllum amplum TaxID=97359 RepID=A0A550CJW7_9AGAR|nr:potassium transporter [Auriculariopsis ampla]